MRISLVLSLSCLLPVCLQAQEPSTPYKIIYSGRTLGYYRTPDLQPASPSVACPAGNDEPGQVEAFRRQVSAIPEPKILVATGDNFSPDLGARSVCNEKGQLIPKERNAWTGSDNVATFFRLLGFSAIVPGKLDFHFGPERLRQIARYLASRNAPGSPVQMLASNMTIVTTAAHLPEQIPAPPPAENYSITSAEGTKVHLPKVLLPYIRQFDIDEGATVSTTVTATSGAVQTQALSSRDLNTPGQRGEPVSRFQFAWLCPGELGTEFRLPASCRPLLVEPPLGTTVTVRMPTDWPVFPSRDSVLKAGAPAYVCASAVNSERQFAKGNTVCSGTLWPQVPYFQSGDDAVSPNPQPYAIVDRAATVIFGVVDPVLLAEIGELNYAWRNSDPAFDTHIQVGDPLEALAQVLQTCEADRTCRGKRKILLVQAPLSKAQRISVALRGLFDAVVTQADAESATGDATLTEQSKSNVLPPLVLVPAPNYSNSDQNHLQVTMRLAAIRFGAGTRTLENRVYQDQVELTPRPFTGDTPLWQLMVSAELSPAPTHADYKAVVLNSVLNAMKRYCKSDVAVLQHRDLFIPVSYAFKQPSPGQLQELLDELLWKDDLVTCRAVSGKVLTQMKADSDRYDSEDEDRLTDHVEYGRGLDYLGMFQNDEGLTIDGNPVKPGDLYSIATTDFLGAGDTGYEALHDPSIPPPERIAEMKRLEEVSSLACDAIANGFPEEQRAKTTCRRAPDPGTYFDEITMAPFSNPGGLSLPKKLNVWTAQNWASHNILSPATKNPAELQAQNKRVLSLRLDRADAAFLQNLHSLNETKQQNRFSGVQAPEATAPEKFDASLDWLLRLTSSSKNADRFIQTDAQYEISGIRQIFSTTANGESGKVATEPYQLSLPKNTVGIEAGITTHLIPGHQKNVTGVKLLTSARFETELGGPLLQLQATDGFLNETLPRKNSLFGKLGLRYDGARSWLEAGFQSGPFTQVNSLKLGPQTCDPGNVTNCVSPDGGPTILRLSQLDNRAFSVQSARRFQSGLFFNARVHVPVLYKRFDYVIENAGTLYINRAGDSSAATRYLEVMTHTLAVPVVGNLSIVPKVELFFFQNKVAGWHIHGYQTSIGAQYRFDWHTGLHWGEALRFPNPPPGQ